MRMLRMTVRLVGLVVVAGALSGATASDPGHAAGTVTPGTDPEAVLSGGVRFRSFGNSLDPEVYAGLDIDPPSSSMVVQQLTWAAVNPVTVVYDPARDRLTTTVGGNPPLVFDGFVPAAPLNLLQITVRERESSGTVDLNNVTVNGFALGSFTTSMPAPAPGCYTSNVLIPWLFPNDTCDWSVSGIDLSHGFVLTADVVLGGQAIFCGECRKVDLRFGSVPSQDAEGPEVTALSVDPAVIVVGGGLGLAAVASDEHHGGSAIARVEYRVGQRGWAPLAPVDGAFDEMTEAGEASEPAPLEAGFPDVCARAVDTNGNTGAPRCVKAVLFDPDAGFVTGAGWLEDPGEAGPAGRVSFGLVSRYERGALVPSGSVEIQVQRLGLTFHADTQEWLVVEQGERAILQGTGSVGGEDGFAFTAWLTDGGRRGSDTVRLRIVDERSGDVVYDSGEPQPLGGGSVQVHAGKR